MTSPEQNKRKARFMAYTIGAVALTVVGVLLLIVSGPTLTKADGGTVVVVRNGGWFDDTTVRDVVQPNSSITWEGWHSDEHPYPASQRFFRVGPEGTADSQEIINVPTADGVNLGIEGTWYFELNTDPAVLTAFDNQFGTRTYQVGDDRFYAWQEEGWPAFLDSTFSTTAQNSSRQALNTRACADLIPSCVLVQGASTTEEVKAEELVDDAGAAASTLVTIQQEMASTFAEEANQILGKDVLKNVQFSLTRLTLPQALQDSITASLQTRTDSKAKIAAAEATKQQAQAEADANITRQNGYNSCPVCGEIELRKAIPPGVTVWAPGGEAAIAVQQPAAAPAG